MKAKKCLAAALSVLLVALMAYDLIIIGMLSREIVPPPIEYSKQDRSKALAILIPQYDTSILYTRNKEEYRAIIESELDISFYIYIETNNAGGFDGRTRACVRTIIIDRNLQDYKYCLTFVHEAIHLKKLIGNETLVEFEVFKYLYENKDKELHNMGVEFGIKQLLKRNYNGEYDCSNYIVDYLI